MTGAAFYPAASAAALEPMAEAERELAAAGMLGLAAIVRLAGASVAYATAEAAPAGSVAAGKAAAQLARLGHAGGAGQPRGTRPADPLHLRVAEPAGRVLARLEARTIGADLPAVRPLSTAELSALGAGGGDRLGR